jgi:hypothetical protein
LASGETEIVPYRSRPTLAWGGIVLVLF